ncbi:hypothetical protein MRX96_011660 [Rhipicephalus microplus]
MGADRTLLLFFFLAATATFASCADGDPRSGLPPKPPCGELTCPPECEKETVTPTHRCPCQADPAEIRRAALSPRTAKHDSRESHENRTSRSRREHTRLDHNGHKNGLRHANHTAPNVNGTELRQVHRPVPEEVRASFGRHHHNHHQPLHHQADHHYKHSLNKPYLSHAVQKPPNY